MAMVNARAWVVGTGTLALAGLLCLAAPRSGDASQLGSCFAGVCTSTSRCDDTCWIDTGAQGRQWMSCDQWSNGNCVRCWTETYRHRELGRHVSFALLRTTWLKRRDLVCNNGDRYQIEQFCDVDTSGVCLGEESRCCRTFGCWGQSGC
jgi:hypothetical protein